MERGLWEVYVVLQAKRCGNPDYLLVQVSRMGDYEGGDARYAT